MSVVLLAAVTAQAFSAIPRESAAALGVTKNRKPFTEGLVFVNGKFVPPPYVVERWGTGIRINKIPVTGQIVPWSEFLKTQKDVVVETTATPPAEAGESPSADAKPSAAPEAPSASEPGDPPAAEPPPAESQSGDDSASLDDLFSAAEPSAPATVVFVERELAAPGDFGTVTEIDGHPVSRLDSRGSEPSDGEGDEPEGGEGADAASEPETPADEPPPPPKEETPKPKAKPRKAPPKPRTRMVLKGAFVKNEATKAMVAKINAQRTEIDRTLRGGGFICFGDRYARISGDRAAMARLLSALPEIERKSETLDQFCNSVRAASLIYLHQLVCEDLFANRIDYRALQEYRTKLRKDREWKKMMDGAQPAY